MIAYDPEKITFFAKTDARGQQVPFGIKAKDRQRHMYVIGKTGMGKSTLLENMAAQDIQSGEGMAFIDPHGAAIETLLEYVPEHRLDDVVYFAPFDMENPIGFNIMEDVGVDTRHLVVSGLMSTFKKIWEDAWSARMEYILTNALLALIEYPGTTLLSVNRMLADKKYRDKVVENIKDPAVKAYWVDEFASYTERFAAEALPAIQNKIGQFTGNPLIRNIIGQPKSTFDVRKMMDEKKILLINLSKGLVGETNADLIGSMLITKIYLAAMSRADLPPAQMKEMPNFYFYVDEFQSFANSTFANILSEARKYHLNLIIAHQYVAQMEEKIRDAVFGNVGTTIAFRTGPFDAEVLETVFAPQFEATDLVNLGFAQIYLSLMIDGVGSQPFSAVTLPPVQTPQVSHKQMVIKRSQKNYTLPRSVVEQTVIDSHAPVDRIADAAESGGGNKGGFSKPSAFHKVGSDNNGSSNKNGNQSNGSKNNGNRPKPATKTADDLKDILAGMTGQNTQSAASGSNQTKDDTTTKAPATSQDKASDQTKLPKESHQAKLPEPKSADKAADTKTKEEQSQPAQNKNTPPQNQAPRSQSNQSTTTETTSKATAGATTGQNRNRPQQTTPDDLRAILAKMTGKIEANKAQSDSGDKGGRNARSNPNHNASRQNVRSNGNRNDTKASGNDTKDLRGVLQDVGSNKNQRSTTTESKPANKPRATEPLRAKEDLKTALAKALKRGEQSGGQAKAQPVSAQPEAKPQPATTSDLTFGGSRQPAYVPHPQSSGPDLETAKKLLRHSGKERPPGTH